MLKVKKMIPIIGVFFIIAILFLTFGTPRYRSMKIKNMSFEGLENKLKEAVETNGELDVNKLTDFDWDECYVFTPYYPPEAIYEKAGVEWTTTKTYVEFLLFHDMENQTINDDEYVMVFKKDGKVILSAKYSLKQLPVVFKLDECKFSSSNANFIVSVGKQYDQGSIKELILKDTDNAEVYLIKW